MIVMGKRTAVQSRRENTRVKQVIRLSGPAVQDSCSKCAFKSSGRNSSCTQHEPRRHSEVCSLEKVQKSDGLHCGSRTRFQPDCAIFMLLCSECELSPTSAVDSLPKRMTRRLSYRTCSQGYLAGRGYLRCAFVEISGFRDFHRDF